MKKNLILLLALMVTNLLQAQTSTKKYEAIGNLSEGLAPALWNSKFGFIDKNGYEVIPFLYDGDAGVNPFKNGMAGVRLNGKWGIIDKKGKQITPFKYDECSISDDGIRIKLNGKYTCKGNCTAKYMAVLKNNTTGAVIQNYPAFSFPYSYNFPAAGDYRLEITPVCGNKKCPPCVIYFSAQ